MTDLAIEPVRHCRDKPDGIGPPADRAALPGIRERALQRGPAIRGSGGGLG